MIKTCSRLPMFLFAVTVAVWMAGCGNESKPLSVNSADVTSATPTPNPVISKPVPTVEPAPDVSTLAVPESNDSDTVADTEAKPPEAPTPEAPTSEVAASAAADLEQQLASFQVPPAWFDTVNPAWDTAKPWSEARQEIRRLLGTGDDALRREGIKLTWEYLQKDDIGDGHEYGMYMFLGKEPIWAVKVYREWLAKSDHKYPPYFGIKALASLYADFGLHELAEPVLQRGLKTPPPDPQWNEMREAEMHDALGDLYVAWGKTDKAKASYAEAMRLYPLGKPPYGKHLLPRRVKKVQSKLDLLSISSLAGTSLRDGRYNETALGYSGDIKLTVDIQAGRIANIDVEHEEKIDQNSCVLVPERIIKQQSLQVDGVTGATVTQDAIEGGTLRALKQAGLE